MKFKGISIKHRERENSSVAYRYMCGRLQLCCRGRLASVVSNVMLLRATDVTDWRKMLL